MLMQATKTAETGSAEADIFMPRTAVLTEVVDKPAAAGLPLYNFSELFSMNYHTLLYADRGLVLQAGLLSDSGELVEPSDKRRASTLSLLFYRDISPGTYGWQLTVADVDPSKGRSMYQVDVDRTSTRITAYLFNGQGSMQPAIMPPGSEATSQLVNTVTSLAKHDRVTRLALELEKQRLKANRALGDFQIRASGMLRQDWWIENEIAQREEREKRIGFTALVPFRPAVCSLPPKVINKIL